MPPQQLNAAAIADDIPVVSVSSVHAAALQKAGELLQNIHSAERKVAATHIAQHIKQHGVSSLDEFAVVSPLQDAMNKQGKTGGDSREGACLTVSALISEMGAPVVPYLLPVFGTVIELMGDKVRPVQLAAQEAGNAFVAALPPNAVRIALPALLARNTRWQSNLFRMEAIQKLVQMAPLQINRCMGELVPAMSEAMWDLKPEVKSAAKAAMEATCNAVDNRDIKPFIPNLIKSIETPKEVPETVHLLSAVQFVQSVDYAALSIMSPLLVRGLGERAIATKRQCARIIENMSKLVDEPSDVAPFLPKLLPLLEIAKKEVSDPECRDVCEKAYETLQKKGDTTNSHVAKLSSAEALAPIAKSALGESAGKLPAHVLDFVCGLALALVDIKMFEAEAWTNTITPFVAPYAEADAAADVPKQLLAAVVADVTPEEDSVEADDAEELCNTTFSLAYGSKILLNNTQLKLMRGHRYGLVGQNDSGKTSLLRAIANHKVDGFPPADEVRTVFVETDIQGELSDLCVLDYMFADPLLQDCGISREEMAKVLNSVGFTEDSPANITTPVGSLSGGWKMKLALARAMCLKADVLMLDQPTNHLDVLNVKWVENFLNSLTNVTSIIVSHDRSMLDNVCTHMIEIDQLKLKYYKGNLSEFVKVRPEAVTYFELAASKTTFRFPPPGPLEGINSKGKPILKMTDITFTYPGASKPQLRNVTVRCSLASRVACLGVNGAGKSTMIKLLTGELKADEGSGEVWKHPNARVAYVAQHAFHHIESHLDKTPNEYIRWRYEHGKDKEALEKVTMVMTPEEEAAIKKPMLVEIELADGTTKKEKRVFDEFTEGRREVRKRLEYEIRWEGFSEPSWVPQQQLLDAGFSKILKQVDEAIAMRASSYGRPLTMANVEKHLEDVGLDREFGSHMRIRALSGGQKVKVVLAAAMWNCPHLLILDEPTNYLDRESLGALAGAIREFDGGVVMITHNNEFCSALCPETWLVENNTVNLKGDPEWMKQVANEKIAVQEFNETMLDKFGNEVKVKGPKKKLSRQEQKKKEKIRKMRLAQGLPVSDDDEWDE